MQSITRTSPTWVYSLADAEVRPLYVGVTANLDIRLRTHRREKWWWPQVVFVHAHLYATREEALAWEAVEIRGGTPHNVDVPRARSIPEGWNPNTSALRILQLLPGEDI